MTKTHEDDRTHLFPVFDGEPLDPGPSLPKDWRLEKALRTHGYATHLATLRANGEDSRRYSLCSENFLRPETIDTIQDGFTRSFICSYLKHGIISEEEVDKYFLNRSPDPTLREEIDMRYEEYRQFVLGDAHQTEEQIASDKRKIEYMLPKFNGQAGAVQEEIALFQDSNRPENWYVDSWHSTHTTPNTKIATMDEHFPADHNAGAIVLDISGLQDRREVYIRQMYVDPKYWGTGTAEWLLFSIWHMILIESDLGSIPFEDVTITLETRRLNEPAKRLYQKMGFVELPAENPYARHDPSTYVTMVRPMFDFDEQYSLRLQRTDVMGKPGR